MPQNRITLPLPKRATDNGLKILVPILNQVTTHSEVNFDFSNVAFYHPAPIVVLLSRINFWQKQGKKIFISNYRNCPAAEYLQRIDFFDQLGIHFDEKFIRQEAQGRFVTIKRVITEREVDLIAREVANCMSHHQSDPRDLTESLSFALGEILTNVAQHSYGEGFICAQYYPMKRKVHVAISDNGIGLQKSFEGTPLETTLTTPLAALEKAMEPEVSAALLRPPTGPYHQYVNRGIGLSMVNELTRQTYGYMRIITENAIFRRIGDTSVKFFEDNNLRSPGVTVELEINIDEIGNFEELITSVREDVIPSELDNWDEMFD